MEKKLATLKMLLQEVNDLNAAIGVLSWDQSTYMPPGAAVARGRQMGTLTQLAHEKFVNPEIGKLLDDLQPYADSLSYDNDDASLIRVTRRQYEKNVRIPSALLAEATAHFAESYQVWMTARPNNDFTAVAPYLQKTIEYSRQVADCFPGYDHIADPLIDFSDEGMTAVAIQALFGELRQQLVPLAQAIARQPQPDTSFLHQPFAEQDQLDFSLKIAEQFGYDLKRGRQDISHHPFCINFSINDVRITTRTRANDLSEALFSTLHEAGHAMYEQGVAPHFEATPLASGTSSGVHESQSRLWENIVGRSYPFWQHYFPQLQTVFPTQLNNVSLDAFYQAINFVQPSLIRTDADEVTYNLHVMLRFDLELQLLDGRLAVKDLPAAWHGRYQSDLGLQAPDNSDGVLQDMHWFGSFVGGQFQGYTLGNIMSSLFYEQAITTHPNILNELSGGKFNTLHQWLRENIYQHGSKFTANELVQRITGQPLTIDPYIHYLKTKFGTLYNLD